jgi:hypothetical protein
VNFSHSLFSLRLYVFSLVCSFSSARCIYISSFQAHVLSTHTQTHGLPPRSAFTCPHSDQRRSPPSVTLALGARVGYRVPCIGPDLLGSRSDVCVLSHTDERSLLTRRRFNFALDHTSPAAAQRAIAVLPAFRGPSTT